ncbi:(d)CMP kinase [Desulfoplanes formicivorans]|uniref:Cytidylate kinase n=1 Tax=Desulfoplanes formicivorans TaxID=1592317 RepID=A0A194ALZ7_9BACT|nr:(d)CMP kinase [Desulfoplanes formicivorans]GAU09679.1 cytidylate kinase [Desulfoplanes formicivorans]
MGAERGKPLFVVTIDGPAGVGKTTLARAVAEKLGVAYLDTGAMYRSVAWMLGKGSWEWSEEKLDRGLDKLAFSIQGAGEATILLVNGHETGSKIRTETVGLWASHVAKIPQVRRRLTEIQRSLGQSVSLVAEGRDMGTVVFPKALFKFFLDASPEVRARRRWLQLRDAGSTEDLEGLTRQMRIRDEQDRNRAIAPLRPAEDAVCIDTGMLDPAQVLEQIIRRIASQMP